MNDNPFQHLLTCFPFYTTEIVSADNAYLFDSQDKKIVDLEAGVWATSIGHCNKEVNEVIQKQMNEVMHLNYRFQNKNVECSGNAVLNLFNYSNGKVVFLSSGSEAVEFIQKAARVIYPNRKMLTFAHAHLSAFTESPRDKNKWVEVNYLNCNNCLKKDCSKTCSNLEHIDFSEIGIFMFESAISGPVIFPPQKLVKLLGQESKKHNALIAANEVTTGFGRTGKWFGFQHFDIEPDLVAMGKGIGNGYPVSVVAMNGFIGDLLTEKNMIHCQSHQNDPLGAVIAEKVINIIHRDNLVDRASYLGRKLEDFFTQLMQSNSNIKEVRVKGLMAAIVFDDKYDIQLLGDRLFEAGYFVYPIPSMNIIRFSPALTIPEKDLDGFCNALSALLATGL